jgi:hypothetical protein
LTIHHLVTMVQVERVFTGSSASVKKRITDSDPLREALINGNPAEVTLIQRKSCKCYRVELDEKCTGCRGRRTGDACRFVNIRELTLQDGLVKSVRFVSTEQKETARLPEVWAGQSPLPEYISILKVGGWVFNVESFVFMCLGFIYLARRFVLAHRAIEVGARPCSSSQYYLSAT